MRFRLVTLLHLLMFSLLSLHAAAQDQEAELAAEMAKKFQYSESKAMRTLGLPDSIAKPLKAYYQATFGGGDNWAKVQSIRFDGILHLPQGKLRFIAFKKKPDLCKVVLYGAGDLRMIMAYDGSDAWQLMNAEFDDPVDMPELEALNFIRDAEIGGNLMYPNFSGKQIERLPDREVDEVDCVVLLVTRPDGQQVEYALDRALYNERQMIVTNAVSGQREVITYSNFQKVAGLQIPFRSVMHVEGELVHEVQVLRAQVNAGAVPWMFERSAATYIPTAPPLPVEGAPVDLDLGFSAETTDSADFVLPE